MDSPLVVTSSPHLHGGATTRGIMADVLIALMPAAVASVLIFGWRSAAVILVCVASCLAAEYLSCLVLKKPSSVGDMSAVVTGVLLAFNLPVTIPLWQAVIGCVAAIVVAKMMFGGLGQNFVNPALIGRIVMLASFPEAMNKWVEPLKNGTDAVSSATPLALLSQPDATLSSLRNMFFGVRSGCLGETCVIALLLGGVYLVARRVISPVIPVTYLATVFVMTWILGENPFYHLLAGGLMLGAIFMATDYTTSPITTPGKIIYAVGCGLITVLIRLYGSLPEGVSFAIVIMNILVPLIERITRPLPFGEKRRLRHE